MRAYYNECNAYAAQWLRNLITAGHIADGDVDERSIEDVLPRDLDGYIQCHFFAGIGVWSRALRLADWPDDRSVWTGSCPCQPFSAAGARSGFADERHLWPAFHHLIRERRPAIVLGEQVASRDADTWIDLVQDDMEALDYTVGAVPFPAAGVGAPYVRDRLYWVAAAGRPRLAQCQRFAGVSREASDEGTREAVERGSVCSACGLADSNCNGCESGNSTASPAGYRHSVGTKGGDDRHHTTGPTNGFWRAADWLLCRDERWRPTEPGAFPLVDGATARVGRLRAYGNAIVPQAAAAFAQATGLIG